MRTHQMLVKIKEKIFWKGVVRELYYCNHNKNKNNSLTSLSCACHHSSKLIMYMGILCRLKSV